MLNIGRAEQAVVILCELCLHVIIILPLSLDLSLLVLLMSKIMLDIVTRHNRDIGLQKQTGRIYKISLSLPPLFLFSLSLPVCHSHYSSLHLPLSLSLSFHLSRISPISLSHFPLYLAQMQIAIRRPYNEGTLNQRRVAQDERKIYRRRMETASRTNALFKTLLNLEFERSRPVITGWLPICRRRAMFDVTSRKLISFYQSDVLLSP